MVIQLKWAINSLTGSPLDSVFSAIKWEADLPHRVPARIKLNSLSECIWCIIEIYVNSYIKQAWFIRWNQNRLWFLSLSFKNVYTGEVFPYMPGYTDHFSLSCRTLIHLINLHCLVQYNISTSSFRDYSFPTLTLSQALTGPWVQEAT